MANYATQAELSNYALKNEIPDVSNYATTTYVDNKISALPSKEYVDAIDESLSGDISALTTKVVSLEDEIGEINTILEGI